MISAMVIVMKHKIKITEEQINLIESLAGIRLPMDQIAVMISSIGPKMSEDTLERMMKTNDSVREAYLRGKAKSGANYRKTLYEMAVKEKNPRMMEFWGYTQEGFRKTENINLTGKDGAALITSDTEANAKLDKIMARLNKRK